MFRVYQFLQEFIQEDDGPTTEEYALMLALIVVVCLQSVILIGQKANATFLTVGSSMTTSS
jgi:pilus assembly protein Flp/PilA